MENGVVLIAVANVNAQLRILGINTQPDDALIGLRYIFRGLYGVFQSV